MLLFIAIYFIDVKHMMYVICVVKFNFVFSSFFNSSLISLSSLLCTCAAAVNWMLHAHLRLLILKM